MPNFFKVHFRPFGHFVFNQNTKFKKCLNLIILISFLIKDVNCVAIDSSCKCILFSSTYGKDYGIFHSPDWPTPYEDDINCLLYTFQGKNDQIVEITFDEFDLQKASLE